MELKDIQAKIAELRSSEARSKHLIAELIVAVTERIHEHNEVTSANTFLLALSPLNQKKALAFFREFSGHKEQEKILAGRKKEYTKDGVKVNPYQEAHDKFEAFKQSGMNFWQWCVMEKPKDDKPLTAGDVEKAAKKANEKMQEALRLGLIDKVRAFELLLGGVMSQEDMMMVLQSMIKAEDTVTQAAKEAAVA